MKFLRLVLITITVIGSAASAAASDSWMVSEVGDGNALVVYGKGDDLTLGILCSTRFPVVLIANYQGLGSGSSMKLKVDEHSAITYEDELPTVASNGLMSLIGNDSRSWRAVVGPLTMDTMLPNTPLRESPIASTMPIEVLESVAFQSQAITKANEDSSEWRALIGQLKTGSTVQVQAIFKFGVARASVRLKGSSAAISQWEQSCREKGWMFN